LSSASASPSLLGRLFVGLQHLLPQHALSRLVLKATRVQARGFKNALISGFLRLYRVDMDEAVESDPLRYASFNEFFTRPLKPALRPIDAAADSIVCPVDGTVSECGPIEADRLLQAKGRFYTLSDLLAGEPWAREFESGQFATIYLAPYNYHRIHMPLAGRLRGTWFVPGRLFSVNRLTADLVPRLFARNERVVTLFDTEAGPMGLVLVGALNVGSMSTVWAQDIAPSPQRRVTRLAPQAVSLPKGAEMGRFNMGSTVILLFPKDRASWNSALRAGQPVRLGQAIGTRR
jgi:phosphatidylserine decarboxylase